MRVVGDDGRFTYIELPKPYHFELPVVFALRDDGSNQLVNFKWDEKNARFVVQELIDKAVLVLGDQKVFFTRS
ncbi:TrbG/VirB9 family P-type conjugative transfer protein [Ralstonia solanacearum]|uniref:TrbG/VirB9 family P-type conjugative transfer protein n=1 Tax=Ralstonia solanacearum TaxID=305 RepID=UPI0005AC7F43|nr:TrbG/VirB9 family P-type conjugative transfer protein [Ralstonia solanacearum]MDC6177147.1 TrbG/VirB9 family P-type conjugative transfer protein [Ralstonia solanacearum]MDC6238321.1 TrbG/VirB9 family P-type conjugative transfer protein [Ralstonia solanacearum]